MNANAIVQSNLTYSRGHGYYDDPYKSLDDRPDHRRVVAWLTRWNQHFPAHDATLKLAFRVLHDSFGFDLVHDRGGVGAGAAARVHRHAGAALLHAGRRRFLLRSAVPERLRVRASRTRPTRGFGVRRVHASLTVAKVFADGWSADLTRRFLPPEGTGGWAATAARTSCRSPRAGSRSACRRRSDVAPRRGTMRLHAFDFRAMAASHELLLGCDDARARATRRCRGDRRRRTHRGEVLALPRRASCVRDQPRRRRRAGRDRCGDRGAPALRRRLPHAIARALRHHVGRPAPGLGLPALRRRAFRPCARSTRCCRSSTGARSRGTGASIRLPRAGMEIDLGGIGKEYAADRVATILRRRGRARARQPGRRRARVGRAARRRRRGASASAIRARGRDASRGIEIGDGAVATSGDYERVVEVDGRRYCHILDATTGWPVDGWQSMSVAAPLCVVAGSGATIGMLLGDDAPAWLAAEGLDWLGVDAAGEVAAPWAIRARKVGSDSTFHANPVVKARICPRKVESDPTFRRKKRPPGHGGRKVRQR